MTDQQWRWAKVVLSVPGVAGFFLTFTSIFWDGISPLDAATWMGGGFERWLYRALGAVMGLAIFIFGWHLRLAVSARLSHLEIVSCVVLGLAGSLLFAGISLYWIIGIIVDEWSVITANLDDVWGALIEFLFFGIFWCLLSATHLFAVLRFRPRILSNRDAAVAALMAGYLPNATYCLVGFSWAIGAYVVLLACLCYIGMIVATVRRLSLQTAHAEEE